ncbi:MAG: NTE family protein rssA, partial [Phyllobacteriaceae bacterium]|nr:NTE family protein rssA [Phyllobacteriaceae bacterium]
MFSFTRRAFDHVNEGGGAASPMPHARRPKIGLALSSGVARGWSHIGVVQEFAAQGIHFDVIAGTSIGAVVGGCHAAGRLDAIESFARSLTKRSVLGLMDFSFSSVGLIGGGKLKGRLL